MRFILISIVACFQLSAFASNQNPKESKTPAVVCVGKTTAQKNKELSTKPACKSGKVSTSSEKGRVSKNPN